MDLRSFCTWDKHKVDIDKIYESYRSTFIFPGFPEFSTMGGGGGVCVIKNINLQILKIEPKIKKLKNVFKTKIYMVTFTVGAVQIH